MAMNWTNFWNCNPMLCKEAGLQSSPLACYLRELESWHITFPSMGRPPVLQTTFFRQFPKEEVVATLSPFVVIRAMGRRYNEQILSVNYVSGRCVRRPSRDRGLLDALS